MSDQNQFDQYKQKLLHYWALFLAGCGTLWEKIKVYARKAADFLRRNGKLLAQKLTEFGKTAAQWLRELWARIRPWCRRVVQTVASWLLLAKEKSEPVIEKAKLWTGTAIGKAKVWTSAQIDRLRQKKEALPAPESNIVDAEAAEVVEEETAVPEQPAPELRKLPAWCTEPWMVKTFAVLAAIGLGIKFVIKWICKLYKVFLAAPVVWYAIRFARENMERLPEEVGLDIQSTGEFARMISRQEAVYWPLGITLFCLVLMFVSKKPILPWVISIFTLVLPWLIWILNYYA